MTKKFLDSAGLNALLCKLKEKFVELTNKITIKATYIDKDSQTHNTTVESDFNTAEITFKADGDLTVSVDNINGKPIVTYNAISSETKDNLYTIKPREMTEQEQSLYSTVYQLYKQEGEQGTPIAVAGSVINIPLDFLVKDAELKTCVENDNPVEGYIVGDKYIDFTINTKTGQGETTHLYINLKDFVDTYIAGNGIDIVDKEISVKAKAKGGIIVNSNGVAVSVANTNGLGLNSSGEISINLVDTTNAGAMSSADKTKLDTLEEMNALTSIEINSIINEVFPVSEP